MLLLFDCRICDCHVVAGFDMVEGAYGFIQKTERT